VREKEEERERGREGGREGGKEGRKGGKEAGGQSLENETEFSLLFETIKTAFPFYFLLLLLFISSFIKNVTDANEGGGASDCSRFGLEWRSGKRSDEQ